MAIRCSLILGMLTLSACASSRTPGSREIFDEQTGNTLSVAAQPMIFARERTDVGAHVRDYATLVAVEVDHSGDFVDYLLLYRWSTVDPRMSGPTKPNGGELRILAEGRVIDLMPLERLPISSSQHARLHLPEHGVVATAYQVDPMTLRFIASSRVLAVRMPQESLDVPFGVWRDGRQALSRFMQSAAAP